METLRLLAWIALGSSVDAPPAIAGRGLETRASANAAALGGKTFHHQVFVVDLGAPGFLSTTNGLTVTYGL